MICSFPADAEGSSVHLFSAMLVQLSCALLLLLSLSFVLSVPESSKTSTFGQDALCFCCRYGLVCVNFDFKTEQHDILQQDIHVHFPED